MRKEIDRTKVSLDDPKRRTPGPLDMDAKGPVAYDIVIKKGTPVFMGGRSQIAKRDIVFKPPLDKGEVGSGWNSYD